MNAQEVHILLWLGIGFGMTLAGCISARIISDVRNATGLLIDAIVPTVVFIVLASLTTRPIFSGLMCLVLGIGYGLANHSKKKVLREPIVFTDIYQAIDVFRHPKLALPFPKVGPILCGAVAIGAILAGLFSLEASLWSFRIFHLPIVGGVLYGLGQAANSFLRPRIVKALYKMKPSGDLEVDTKIFGPFGILLAYGLLASAERDWRRERLLPATPLSMAPHKGSELGHVVLVQSESFFDPRCIKGIDLKLLPNWDSCISAGAQWGRLSVPSWGANTVRTEFSILTGIDQKDLGYDRFNPYHRFARKPVTSLASALKQKGYRTICVHPFDKRFYGRNIVLPQLGFDEFIDESAFISPQLDNGFISDADVSRLIADMLTGSAQPIFLFVITMENHGPWPIQCPGLEIKRTRNLSLTTESRIAFEQYLQCLEKADTMLGVVREAMQKSLVPGTLGFYGDHLPALASTFKQLNHSDPRSDYLILPIGGPARTKKDLTTKELHYDFLKILA